MQYNDWDRAIRSKGDECDDNGEPWSKLIGVSKTTKGKSQLFYVAISEEPLFWHEKTRVQCQREQDGGVLMVSTTRTLNSLFRIHVRLVIINFNIHLFVNDLFLRLVVVVILRLFYRSLKNQIY